MRPRSGSWKGGTARESKTAQQKEEPDDKLSQPQSAEMPHLVQERAAQMAPGFDEAGSLRRDATPDQARQIRTAEREGRNPR
jgi:hypothetical protein